MKRLNNLFDRIVDRNNIELADIKARRNKRNRYGILKHDKTHDLDNYILELLLKFGLYRTSKYDTFKIYEPKERIIYRLPYYPDRILHHAIMNIMESIWINIFTKDTYSCIKGRGIHFLLNNLTFDLRKDPNSTKYCAKMDIKKFYPSIDHDILKIIIRKKVKDKKLLFILDEIIDSASGVPIGNYLSQFFANLYLAYFDHWIKEELKVKYYYRYADDIVLLSDSKTQLKSWILAIKIYLKYILKLSLKDNYQIFPVASRGIDFVGYVSFHNYIKLRKSIKNNLKRLLNRYTRGKLNKESLTKRISSYFGWLQHCDSKHLLSLIDNSVNIKVSRWNGKHTTISSFKGKWIYIVNIEIRNKYFKVQFIYNKHSFQFNSSNKKLLNIIKQINIIKI